MSAAVKYITDKGKKRKFCVRNLNAVSTIYRGPKGVSGKNLSMKKNETIIEMVANAIKNGDPKGIVRAGVKAGEVPGKMLNDLIDRIFDRLEGKKAKA